MRRVSGIPVRRSSQSCLACRKFPWSLRSRSLLVLVAGLGLLLGGFGCAITPEEELRLGAETHGKIEQEFKGLYPDPQVQQYVHTIGLKMAVYANRPDMNWQYRVVNSEQVNAFAVPGGYIYITKGLLFRLRNEAQLAAILGHETAHIAHRDSAEQLERQQQLGLLSGGVGIFAGSEAGTLAELVAGLTSLTYSRDQEKAADLAGIGYMSQAGYNPEGMVQAMQIMEEAAKGSSPPEFLSSHPNPGNRIEYLTEAIQRSYAHAARSGYFGADRFQRNVPLAQEPARTP